MNDISKNKKHLTATAVSLIVSQVVVAFISSCVAFMDGFGVHTFFTGATVGVIIMVILLLLSVPVGGKKLLESEKKIRISVALIFILGSIATALVTLFRAALTFFYFPA